MGKWIPKKGRRRYYPLTIDNSRVAPLAIDNSRVVPMTVSGEFEIKWEWVDEQNRARKVYYKV